MNRSMMIGPKSESTILEPNVPLTVENGSPTAETVGGLLGGMD